jgi:hypothetical protein
MRLQVGAMVEKPAMVCEFFARCGVSGIQPCAQARGLLLVLRNFYRQIPKRVEQFSPGIFQGIASLGVALRVA